MDIGLYIVLTSPRAGYRACAEAAVRANVSFIQLRMKHASDAEILATGQELRSITKGTSTRFILNDNPALAVQCDADGVHVGQDDISVAEVRRRFPELRVIGLSTHSMEQMRSAEKQRGASLPTCAEATHQPRKSGDLRHVGDARPPDYIGIGPVFATPTKPDYGSLGLATAAAIATATSLPYVAIGGIDATTLPHVLAAGIRHVAVVRAVCDSPHPYDAIRRLQETISAIG